MFALSVSAITRMPVGAHSFATALAARWLRHRTGECREKRYGLKLLAMARARAALRTSDLIAARRGQHQGQGLARFPIVIDDEM